MIKDGLSPDEINGLLGKQGKEENKVFNGSLSQFEKEALIEFLNVSYGSTSSILSTFFSEKVTVMTPEISILQKGQVTNIVPEPFYVVLGQFKGAISGTQFLFLQNSDVEEITKMIDEERTNEIESQFKIIQEMVEQMFVTISHSMTTIIEQEVKYDVTMMDVVGDAQNFYISNFVEDEWFVHAAFQLIVGNNKKLTFHLCIPAQLARLMIGMLTEPIIEETTTTDPIQERKTQFMPNIQPVQFSSFDEGISSQSESHNLNMLLDVPLEVTVELGRTKRLVKEILQVSPGSIIELDKLAGEPVDILVNNKLIAVGEVVVIDENFGVRVTDILSTVDRISKLK